MLRARWQSLCKAEKCLDECLPIEYRQKRKVRSISEPLLAGMMSKVIPACDRSHSIYQAIRHL